MTQPSPPWGRYAELRPDVLDTIREQVAVAYLPWGALEWHGPHLPLGLDGLIAEAIAERAVRRSGGVLLPTTWWPITAVPHPASLSIRSGVVRSLWDNIFAALSTAGWQVVVVVSGHYTPGHEAILMDAAEHAISEHGLLTFALPPLALVDETMLDHGGIWETSQLLALRPDLVQLDALGDGPLHVGECGVFGRDPRDTASPSLGNQALNLAVERISGAVQKLLNDPNPAPLHTLYAERRTRLRPYFERYGQGSVEEAIAAWWRDQTREA